MAPPKAERGQPGSLTRLHSGEKDRSTGTPPAKHNPTKRQGQISLRKSHKGRKSEVQQARARKCEKYRFGHGHEDEQEQEHFESSTSYAQKAKPKSASKPMPDYSMQKEKEASPLQRKKAVLRWGSMLSASKK